MQVITAKDAKSRFGELLDTMQREPVLVTKNKRPVGVFLSLKDVKGTHLESLLILKVMIMKSGKRENSRSPKFFEITSITNDCNENGTCYSDAKARELVASRSK